MTFLNHPRHAKAFQHPIIKVAIAQIGHDVNFAQTCPVGS
jgi:hypothetical protein